MLKKEKYERGLDLVGDGVGWSPDSRVHPFTQARGGPKLLGKQ